jgi:spermidine synthase
MSDVRRDATGWGADPPAPASTPSRASTPFRASTPSRTSTPPLAVLAPLLIASGASALVYQVLWLRQLGLVFGVTVQAATAVLSAFMAGLAIGSTVSGRLADRVRSPLFWFGCVEIGVGVLALGSEWVFSWVSSSAGAVHGWLPEPPWARAAARLAGSFAVLALPTTLMGMTLPLVLKAASGAGDGRDGARVGWLYAANTLGAVAGAVGTAFVLVGAFGIAGSYRMAAAVNVAAGLAAILAARTWGRERGPAVVEESGHAPVPAVAFAAFALSGFAALALEVVWFRALVYFVEGTVTAFATMLGSVLLGLALGSAAAAPALRRGAGLVRRFAVLQAATAVAVPLSALALDAAYRAGWRTTGEFHVSVFLAFPPCFLMGMAYPVGLGAWARRGDGAALSATRVGDLNSANLVAGIAGAIAGGFLVLPVAGSRMGLALLSGVFLVSGLLVLWSFSHGPRRALLSVALVALYGLVAPRTPDLVDTVSGRRHPAGEILLWREEGAQGTAAIRRQPGGHRVLYLNGMHQAGEEPGMVQLHRLIGHLPMALHPSPRRALVIGLGGGATAGAVSQHDTTVDIVELSPTVLAGARWFSSVNYDVLDRPNVTIRIDDGRNFLLRGSHRYDVITADVIQPQVAGAGAMYSREYFALVRQALAPGGLALQWIGHPAAPEYRLMLRTFLHVFPEATVWAGGQLLVGSTGPLRLDREAFERQLERPPTRRALEAAGLGSFRQLLDLYVADGGDLAVQAGAGDVLTDDRPRTEYRRHLPVETSPIDFRDVPRDPARHVR